MTPPGAHHRLCDHGSHAVGTLGKYRILDRVGGAHARILVAGPAVGVGGGTWIKPGTSGPNIL